MQVPESFTIPESAVADRVGISVREVKDHRSVGCCEKIARVWLWSESGVMALEQQLAGAVPVEPEKPPAVDRRVFMVQRRRTPRVLHIVEPGEKYDAVRPVALWLPRPVAHLFTPGMKVAGVPRLGNDLVWDYAGNPDPKWPRRFPRRPGTW